MVDISVLPDDRLILLDGYIAYGDRACYCCEECCIQLLGGSFNDAGNLVYTNAYQTLIIEMPTPGSRVICNNDQIKLISTVNPTYSSTINRWHCWHERDWLEISHGPKIGSDLHCGAHCYIWESTQTTIEVELKFTPCFVDYVTQYGEIVIGPVTGNDPQEMINVLAEDVPLDPGTDCCPYTITCLPCQWFFQFLDDPIGPEVTEEGITYWIDDVVTGWSMKTILQGVDKNTKRVDRGDSILPDVGIRWPKFDYPNFEDWRVDLCWVHQNWRDGFGTQDHPRIGLPDLEPAENCYPSPFVEDTGDCPDIHRVPYESPALKYDLGATITECFDEDCGDLLDPLTPEIHASITSENPVVNLSLLMTMPECPNPDNILCCPPQSCWEFNKYQIETLEYPPPSIPQAIQFTVPAGAAVVTMAYKRCDAINENTLYLVYVCHDVNQTDVATITNHLEAQVPNTPPNAASHDPVRYQDLQADIDSEFSCLPPGPGQVYFGPIPYEDVCCP